MFESGQVTPQIKGMVTGDLKIDIHVFLHFSAKWIECVDHRDGFINLNLLDTTTAK